MRCLFALGIACAVCTGTAAGDLSKGPPFRFLGTPGIYVVCSVAGGTDSPIHRAFDAAAREDQGWKTVTGDLATVYLHPDCRLSDIVRYIDVSFARNDPDERAFFYTSTFTEEEVLAHKIDIIIRKDQQLLDMYPDEFRVDVMIVPDMKSLCRVYREIFGTEASHEAFYVYRYNTVYVSASRLSESILAHELAHALIDHYFTVAPPLKIRELLACYCDVHLRE